MPSALLQVAALLSGTAILLLGAGLLTILLPVRATLEGFSTLAVGLITASYYTGFVAGCLLAPHLVRRVGHIRTFAAFAATAASAALLLGLYVSPPTWIGFRAVVGFCLAGLYMVIESWLNERSTNETRGRIFAAYMFVNLSAITAGQFGLAAGDPAADRLFAFAAIGIGFALVPVALTGASAPAPLAQVQLRLGHLYRLSPVGMVGCLFAGLATGAFWGLAPVFATARGLSAGEVALFMGLAIIGGALGQWPLGRISDRADRRHVIIAACLGAAGASAALAALPASPGHADLALAFVAGAFMFSVYSLSVAHANDFIPADQFVEASSGLLLVFGIGAIVGPLLGSAAMAFIGNFGVFAYIAGAHVVLAAFAFARTKKRAPRPVEERSGFVPMSVAAEAGREVLELDPRAPAAAPPEIVPTTPFDGADGAHKPETPVTPPGAEEDPSRARGGT
jgi:MFS family permease